MLISVGSLGVPYGPVWSLGVPLCIVRYFYGGCSRFNTFLMYPVGLCGVLWESCIVPYGPVWSRMILYGPVGVPLGMFMEIIAV